MNTNTSSPVMQFVSGFLLKVAGSALVAASALPQKSDAQVVPYMNVDTTTAVSDYDGSNPGNERLFQYTVTNFGDGDNSNNPDGSAYNLISFTVPAGSNQGVLFAENSGWGASIGSDSTIFTGTLSPDANTTFDLYADDATPTGIVQSTAVASGNTSTQPFRDYDSGNLSSNQYVSVTAPIPEPGTLGLLTGLGALAYVGTRRKPKQEEKPITYEK